MRAKLGLGTSQEHNDQQLADDLLEIFLHQGVDWTNGFVALGNSLQTASAPRDELGNWWDAWQDRLKRSGLSMEQSQEQMMQQNPQVIPRNHLVDAALSQAEQDDWQAWDALLPVIQHPYKAPAEPAFTYPAPEDFAKGFQTFCGT